MRNLLLAMTRLGMQRTPQMRVTARKGHITHAGRRRGASCIPFGVLATLLLGCLVWACNRSSETKALNAFRKQF